MSNARTLSLVALAALSLACGGSADSAGGDENPPAEMMPDAQPAQPTGIPLWSLEDIQPESPRFGETYGLDAFAESVLVAVLVEGF